MNNDFIRCISVNEKFWIFIAISSKHVPKGQIQQNPNIGLDNGLAPNRWQTIIWTNASPIHWRIYAAWGGCEIKWNRYIHMNITYGRKLCESDSKACPHFFVCDASKIYIIYAYIYIYIYILYVASEFCLTCKIFASLICTHAIDTMHN